MKKQIDCLFIGHNETPFVDLEKKMRLMGTKGAYYRDIALDFIRYKGKPYTMQDVINTFIYGNEYGKRIPDKKYLFAYGNIFSNTIAYLGSYLHRHNITFDVIKYYQEQKDELVQYFKNTDVKCVIIPTTHYIWAIPIIDIVELLRSIHVKAKIIVGGPFVSTQSRTSKGESFQYILKLINADYYIDNIQGEYALTKLVNAIKGDTDITSIENIYYKKNDTYLRTNIIPENNILADNPINWKLFDGILGKIVSMRTSISCPFSCSFCGFPERAGKYQYINEEDICSELDILNSIKGVESILFVDDTFNVPLQRFKGLLNRFIKKRYKFKWACFLRCQYLNEDTVALMKESGCELVYLGIESGCNQILDNMHKLTNIEAMSRGLQLLNKYEIPSYASFIAGFPGETEESFQETVNFIEMNRPTFYRIHLWFCEPITKIWNRKEEFGISGSQYNWRHNTMNANDAIALIEKASSSIKSSCWVPQNKFNFTSIIDLLHNGFSIEDIRYLLNIFNQAVTEKVNYGVCEIRPELIAKLSPEK